MTDFQAKVLKLWDAGRDTQQIADELNVLEFAVDAKVTKAREDRLGVSSLPWYSLSRRRRWSEEFGRWI